MRRRSRPLIIADPAQKKLMVMNRKPTKIPPALSDDINNIQTLFSFDGSVKDA